jgi:hypothetical protein
MLSVITLSIAFYYYYAECRYAECRYAECRYAECRYAECRYAECPGGYNIFLSVSNIYLFTPYLHD